MLENVRYGRLDANVEECVNAAKEANIMKFFILKTNNISGKE